VHVAPPYCYRCPFGFNYPRCGLACVKNMETTILGEGPETVAEVIVEPIMSGVGIAVPPDEYLPEVKSLCRRYGLFLHVDEGINGFGRTGKMFAYQHYCGYSGQSGRSGPDVRLWVCRGVVQPAPTSGTGRFLGLLSVP
jgi:adenosylmethionine-8-amino-7-oxononanoate aminotransferase